MVAVKIVTGQPTIQAADTSLELLVRLAPLLYIILAAMWFRANRRSGAMLLDCGPNPRRRLLRIFSGLGFTSLVAPTVLFWRLDLVDWYDLYQATALLFFVTVSFGRAQIRQNGLWLYAGFVPWQEVISYSTERYYQAESPKIHKVQVEVKTGMLKLRQKVTLRVPSTKKKGVLDLLDQHISASVQKTSASAPTERVR